MGTGVRKKKKLGSFPSVSVIFSNMLALLVVGVFGILLIYTSSLRDLIRNNIEVQVYLQKNVTENERIQINKTLSEKDYTLKLDGVPQVRFISREEAAESFIEETGEDFIEFLGENPLLDAVVVKINPEFQDDESLVKVSEDIQSISGVYEVNYVRNLISNINRNMTKISLFLLGIAVLLFFIVALLINNTIKLALFSQRFLIRSMQLVGAKAGFIQQPFLSRAVVHGMLAAVLASTILFGVIRYGEQQIPDLVILNNPTELIILFGSLLILGILIGTLSTYFAIKKYLKLSLDELY